MKIAATLKYRRAIQGLWMRQKHILLESICRYFKEFRIWQLHSLYIKYVSWDECMRNRFIYRLHLPVRTSITKQPATTYFFALSYFRQRRLKDPWCLTLFTSDSHLRHYSVTCTQGCLHPKCIGWMYGHAVPGRRITGPSLYPHPRPHVHLLSVARLNVSSHV